MQWLQLSIRIENNLLVIQKLINSKKELIFFISKIFILHNINYITNYNLFKVFNFRGFGLAFVTGKQKSYFKK